eukprot:274696-Prorocentrum_minimum.AAC.1
MYPAAALHKCHARCHPGSAGVTQVSRSVPSRQRRRYTSVTLSAVQTAAALHKCHARCRPDSGGVTQAWGVGCEFGSLSRCTVGPR